VVNCLRFLIAEKAQVVGIEPNVRAAVYLLSSVFAAERAIGTTLLVAAPKFPR
jgi:hypothetical protein